MKLNLGCGRDIKEDWVNVDSTHNTDSRVIHANLDVYTWTHLPFESNSCSEFLLSHVLEHIQYPLNLFEEMYRVATDNALCTVRCPYGSSDDADEDPTHVRRLFLGSFGYFGQPNFWRADYGYQGDWQVKKITLITYKRFIEKGTEVFLENLRSQRNVVHEMIAELRAIKPARKPLKELQEQPDIEIQITNERS